MNNRLNGANGTTAVAEVELPREVVYRARDCRMSQPSNKALFDAIAAWVAQNYPGEQALDLQLFLRGRDRPVSLPLPLHAATTEAARAFEPTPYQLGILDALAGKAMKVEELVAKVKDRPKFYRDPGGVKELQRHGLVDHDKRAGYFRPDAPPPEMDEE